MIKNGCNVTVIMIVIDKMAIMIVIDKREISFCDDYTYEKYHTSKKQF